MNTQRWLTVTIIAIIVALAFASRFLPDTQDDDSSGQSFPSAIPTLPSDDASEAVITDQAQATDEAIIIPTPLTLRDNMSDEMAAMQETPDLPTGPFILKIGEFIEFDAMHGGSGSATIYQEPEGNRFLRLESFSVTDGPDLRVILATHPAPRTVSELTSGQLIDLGALQSSQGTHEYAIPLEINLELFDSIVIYSRQFEIIFSVATLELQTQPEN